MQDCKVSRQHLEQFASGLLGDDAMAFLEEHIPACSRCVQILDELPSDNSPFAIRPPVDTDQPVDQECQKFLTMVASLNPPELAPTFPGPYTAKSPLGKLGDYSILHLIAQGTYGYVYKAHSSDLKQDVAIKVLKPTVGEIPGATHRFLEEAQKAAGVKHPNIVIVHAVLAPTRDFPWPAFVMRLEDASLAQLLEVSPGGLDPRVAAGYIRQTAEGLAAAHSLALVHRDIKPANLLLDTTSRIVKVADFGVARTLEGIASPPGGSTHGTLAFMSPEQLLSPQSIGPKSDVFNAGATLYNLVTGKFPFSGERCPEQKPVRPRQYNSRIPLDLEAIILKCMEQDPLQRYHATGLAEDLEHFLKDEPVNARGHSLWELLNLWKRRSPRAVALVGGLAVGLVLISLTSIALAINLVHSAAVANQAETRRLQAEIEVEKERVVRGEKDLEETNRRTHDRLVDEGDQAAAAGNWYRAVPLYEKAIADNRPDRRHLEVLKLPGLFLHASAAETEKELKRLDGLKDQLD